MQLLICSKLLQSYLNEERVMDDLHEPDQSAHEMAREGQQQQG